MKSSLPLVLAAMSTLAIGTFAFRLIGPMLHARITFSSRAQRLLETSAVVLLAALVLLSGLTEGHSFADLARPLGVAAGGVLAWRKAPFLVVVLTAAAVAALVRLAR